MPGKVQEDTKSVGSGSNQSLLGVAATKVCWMLDILRTTYSIVTRTVENTRATVGKDSFHGQFSQVQTQAQIYANSS